MASGRTGLTYDDLLEMFPEKDNLQRELIGGELIVTPAPVPRHQRAVAKVVGLLLAYEEQHGGSVYPAPIDVWFTDRDVVQPDVVFLTEASLSKEEAKLIRSAPDLVVEISSPSTRPLELMRKKDLYERHGVPEYWYVDLEANRVEIHRLERERYAGPTVLARGDTVETSLLPGFTGTVDDLIPAD